MVKGKPAAKATKRKASASDTKPTAKKAKLEKETMAKVEPNKEKGTKSSKRGGKTSSDGLLSLITDAKWRSALQDQNETPYFQELQTLVNADYADGNKEIFPERSLIFNALNLTPLDKVKVVIIGQDPYHDNGQAHGLSFSVPRDKAIPPSLKNIYKELQLEGFSTPGHGCLEEWAEQGVLMLNATLTVEAHKPNSHAKYGWQKLTDAIIQVISSQTSGVVFILWGGFAQKKEKLIDNKKHGVIKTAHPSPLSVNKFMKCNCFKDANAALKKLGKTELDWSLK